MTKARIPLLTLLCLPTLLAGPLSLEYEGDITELRELRQVDAHPDSWRVWQPFITQWRNRHLIVAFGAMANGKKGHGGYLCHGVSQ